MMTDSTSMFLSKKRRGVLSFQEPNGIQFAFCRALCRGDECGAMSDLSPFARTPNDLMDLMGIGPSFIIFIYIYIILYYICRDLIIKQQPRNGELVVK